MAPIEPNQQDYPYEGLAERVHVSRRGGGQWNQGLSLVLAVCEDCGALLADQKLHDDFHAALTQGDTDGS